MSVGSHDALLRFGRAGLDSHLLEREVLSRGLSSWRFSPTAFLAGPSVSRIGLWGFNYTSTVHTSKVGREIAGDKQHSRVLLRDAGISVPDGRAYALRQSKAVRRYAQRLGYPVVVKPAASRSGAHAETNLTIDESVGEALGRLVESHTASTRIVVEKHVAGDNYKLLVVDAEVVSAVQVLAPSVVGDGSNSVSALLQAANEARSRNPYLRTRPLKVLGSGGGSRGEGHGSAEHVPPAGELVVLRPLPTRTDMGATVAVTEELHPSVRDLAVAAAAAVPGFSHVGVDLLLADHRTDATAQGAAVIGLDSAPSLALHEFPSAGQGKPVTRAIIEACIDAPAMPRDTPCLDLTLIDTPAPDEWLSTIHQLAGELDLEADIDVDAAAASVHARCWGPGPAIHAVPGLLAARRSSSRPEIIQAIPVAEPGMRP